jgi:chloramphenicol 3-O-phosphotransferase
MDLLFVHGAAASGKLTVAQALRDVVGYPVFHNHLVVDALTEVFPFGSEPFVRLREQFWLAVFADAARAGRSITFTFAPEPTVQPGFAGRARAAVEAHGGRVRFVRLVVSDAEQERRIDAPSRGAFHKLTDLDTLRSLRQLREVAEQPPVDLEIDTEEYTPGRAAELIVERFGLRAEAQQPRYPTSGAEPGP